MGNRSSFRRDEAARDRFSAHSNKSSSASAPGTTTLLVKIGEAGIMRLVAYGRGQLL